MNIFISIDFHEGPIIYVCVCVYIWYICVYVYIYMHMCVYIPIFFPKEIQMCLHKNRLFCWLVLFIVFKKWLAVRISQKRACSLMCKTIECFYRIFLHWPLGKILLKICYIFLFEKKTHKYFLVYSNDSIDPTL